MSLPALDHLAAFSSMLARDPDASVLNHRHLQMLAILCAQGTPVSLANVATIAKVSVSHASRVSDTLVRRGFVTRAAHEIDRRIVLLRPTEAGIALDQRVQRDFHATAPRTNAA